jgi:hypothetical protein
MGLFLSVSFGFHLYWFWSHLQISTFQSILHVNFKIKMALNIMMSLYKGKLCINLIKFACKDIKIFMKSAQSITITKLG